jgi:glycosyltransferase involved in cell wall biosynthesis
MVKISVIIPTYNCSAYLPEAIDSVLRQTYQDFEIIIVNDGSTDNTDEIIKPYLERYPGQVRYFSQLNEGAAVTRNVAIRHSTGEYIALLDADDVWVPDKLEQEVVLLDQYPDVGLVHANITFISENGDRLYTPERNMKFLSRNIFDNLYLRNADISCPTTLIRKECFNRIGLFDEKLSRLGCEDRDLWLRIAKSYKVMYIDKVLALYRVRKGSMSRDITKMLQARYYVLNKLAPERGKFFFLKRRALSKIHRELGDCLLIKNDFTAARKQYGTGLYFWPFSFWLIFNFLKTLLRIKAKGVFVHA